jgi:hypothetical protein
MKTFIGIDPGGVKAFGWCVMDASLPGLSVSRIVTGTCSSISEAIPEIERICETQPIGAGIDAPLYWAQAGERKSDQMVVALLLLVTSIHYAVHVLFKAYSQQLALPKNGHKLQLQSPIPRLYFLYGREL